VVIMLMTENWPEIALKWSGRMFHGKGLGKK